MNINWILTTKPHNAHYLKRYIKFIESCKGSGKIKHHICPKAEDLFPEYTSFKNYPNNLAKLTMRQHILAHWMLWKTFGGSQTNAFHLMVHVNNTRINSKTAERLSIEHGLKTAKLNTARINKTEIARHMGETNKGRKHTIEQRSAHSLRITGTGNPMFGSIRIHTQQTKDLMSESNIGDKNGFYSKTHTDKTKQLLRDKHIGNVAAFDILNSSFVSITKSEFTENKGTKYVGVMHTIAKQYRLLTLH